MVPDPDCARPSLRSITATTTTGRWTSVSAFVGLVDVQFWLVGRDVEHPEGNLLVRLGFAREPAPHGDLPTRYRRQTPTLRVVLWPRGVFFGTPQRDCLLLRGRSPVVVAGVDPDTVYDPTQLTAAAVHGRPCPPDGLQAACDWFAGYEQDVAAVAGVAHRVPRPGPRPTLAPPEPCALDRAWRELAARIGGRKARR